MARLRSGLVMMLAGVAACASSPSVGAQSSTTSARTLAAADSTIYAAFLETVNRKPNDTIFVAGESLALQSISPHYDSVVPGLAAILIKASSPPRPSIALHLPPPIQLITVTTPESVRERAMNGPPGRPNSPGQGSRGVWTFSPIAYSADGKDAMFYYSVACGNRCGESSLVWASKNPAGNWEVRRTAILVIL